MLSIGGLFNFFLKISYGDYSLKQHNTFEYLGCYLHSSLNGESMARRVLEKINTELNYLWKQSSYSMLFSYTTSL